jgi:hypothetical protein
MKVRRLKPDDNINLVAAEQIKELLYDSSETNPLPIFVFDAGYEAVVLPVVCGRGILARFKPIKS